MAEQIRPVWRNWLTLGGFGVALLALLFTLSFLFFDLITPAPSPYIGVWTYLVLPGFMVLGALAAMVGLWVTGRRRLRGAQEGTRIQYYPRIDLNLSAHRRALLVVGLVVALTLPVVGLLSYRGYHYTDSTEFCGKVCHEVMEPQYTAFMRSPHARVECAECHIGAGASWYVKSKLSGLRQVWAVATDSFSRPIPPAIRELRPATETCQQCHWPAQFYGDQHRTIHHFRSDEANTHEFVRMLVKTGGNDPATGPPQGIHWHMTLGYQLEYVAVDDFHQEIPWVKITERATGDARVFRSDGLSAKDPPPAGTHRALDCMDCHNRPTHIFRSPDLRANAALLVDPKLQGLPYAKRELVAALVAPYDGKEAALAGVETALRDFYRTQYPQVSAEREELLAKLIEAAQDIYATSFFPAMNVNWRTYPDNIGHKEFPGCARCHDGKHVSAEGDAISTACGDCHTFLTPPDSDSPELVREGAFTHPVKLEGMHADLLCSACHHGGPARAATCAGCHAQTTALRRADAELLSPFTVAEDSMADLDCQDCHDLSAPLSIDTMQAVCTGCHDPDDDERFKGIVSRWQAELSAALTEAEAAVAEARRQLAQQPAGDAAVERDAQVTRNAEVLKFLRQAGPLHNYEAALEVCRQITAESKDVPGT